MNYSFFIMIAVFASILAAIEFRRINEKHRALEESWNSNKREE